MDREAAAPIRPSDLLAAWNARADYLNTYGDPTSSRLWRTAAVELERALKEFGAEMLTLADAAAVSGYSPDYLRQQVAAGSIPNAGRKNAPRIRRGDLKPKPQGGRGRPVQPRSTNDDLVARIVKTTTTTTKRRR